MNHRPHRDCRCFTPATYPVVTTPTEALYGPQMLLDAWADLSDERIAAFIQGAPS